MWHLYDQILIHCLLPVPVIQMAMLLKLQESANFVESPEGELGESNFQATLWSSHHHRDHPLAIKTDHAPQRQTGPLARSLAKWLVLLSIPLALLGPQSHSFPHSLSYEWNIFGSFFFFPLQQLITCIWAGSPPGVREWNRLLHLTPNVGEQTVVPFAPRQPFLVCNEQVFGDHQSTPGVIIQTRLWSR